MRVFCCYSFLLSWTVEGSASWRIPLGAQLIPGITLAIGCIFLPPSPRLLVAQGRNDEALKTLAKLRLRSEHEVQDDPLLQVSIGCLAFYYLLFCAHYPWLLRFYVSAFLPPPLLSLLRICLGFSGRAIFICFVSYPLIRLAVLLAHTVLIGDA